MHAETDFTPSGFTKARQRLALMAWLQSFGECSTTQARNELGISHPAGRVYELRRAGVEIATHRVQGFALYVLGTSK